MCVLVAAATITQAAAVVQLTQKWYFNYSNQIRDPATGDYIVWGNSHQSGFTAWDFDNDGKMEVFWGGRKGHSKRWWMIEDDGTLKWIYPPLDDDTWTGDCLSKPSIVDVDNDGAYEVCFAGRGGRFDCLELDGSWKWTYQHPENQNLLGSPQALDVDGDGFPEFFLNTADSYIFRIDHNGEFVWKTTESGESNEGGCVISDIDQDGEFEVTVGSQDGNLYCYNANTGSEEWRYQTGNKMQTNPNIVADVNNDGEYEAVCWNGQGLEAGASGHIYVISFYGTELWRWAYPVPDQQVALSNAIGDVDGDGRLDIAYQFDGGMGVVTLMGDTMWYANVTEWSEAGLLPAPAKNDDFSSYQLIADIDGDGEQEILWQLPYPIVTDAKTGELEAYFYEDYIKAGARAEDGSWWGDVDGDGISEWICHCCGPSHEKTTIQCLTMGGSFPADAWYPELYHCAYPVEYQVAQSWLKMPAAYSNSLWFPMPEGLVASILVIIGLAVFKRRN